PFRPAWAVRETRSSTPARKVSLFAASAVQLLRTGSSVAASNVASCPPLPRSAASHASSASLRHALIAAAYCVAQLAAAPPDATTQRWSVALLSLLPLSLLPHAATVSQSRMSTAMDDLDCILVSFPSFMASTGKA